MKRSLEKIKEHGFSPNNILDIGALFGNWSKEASEVFPSAKLTMVDPIKHKEHEQFYDNQFFGHQNWEIRYCILDKEEREVDWFEGPTWSGDSMFRERTSLYANCDVSKKNTTTLDLEFSDFFQSGPELIKIDTQGAEVPILMGGQTTIKSTEVIILELPFFGQYNHDSFSFSECIAYMDSIEFVPFDICDKHLINDIFIQIDIMFVRKNHNLHNKFQSIIDNWV
jgi:FkbM family methyltransferase